MLEAKYFKDYKHNYMILQCGQEEAVRSYQYKILTSDKIKEILRCSVRHINGTTYYYYDISSRTTLKSLYQSTKMSYEQVKDLLWQIHGICDRLAAFFMEETGLVLLPEHIYYDFSTRKYIGLYYPDYRVTGAEAYEPLMNFLLEHIDTEDRQLAELMYRICDMAGESHFMIEDVLQILEEREGGGQDNIPDKAEESVRLDDYHLSPMEPLNEEKSKPKQGSFYDTDDNSVPSGPQKEARKQGRSMFYPIFAVLSALCIAGAATVYSLYELKQEEEIALYGIMAVLGVCFLFSLWAAFRKNAQKRETGNEITESAGGIFEESFSGIPDGGRADDISDRGRDGMTDRGLNETKIRNSGEIFHGASGDSISLDNVISRDMGPEPVMPQTMPMRTRDNLSSAADSVQKRETDYYGNTIFYDESKMAEHKLYATDRRNKRHIELKQFPCTIGKMAGCVDYVLADNSVSRIHARFDMQGDRVLMTDMNSTNGTYKNGLRMQPQETVEIEPGDEVRFGNLNYCYR